jgi:hypothetical protein
VAGGRWPSSQTTDFTDHTDEDLRPERLLLTAEPSYGEPQSGMARLPNTTKTPTGPIACGRWSVVCRRPQCPEGRWGRCDG